jgi:steroid 5-alpha reductase family enzyme
MTPLIVVVWVASAACAFAWIASLVTGDTSWVDRSWSIVPIVYAWVFAGFAHLANARLDVMAALVTVWGVRLTFNFARKGGYSGVEDYRWPVLRASMPPWQFQLFNVFFIVLYQNFLLVLITLPALTAYQHRATPYGALDVVLTAIFLAFTLGETVADEQQWRFQSHKRAELAEGRSPERQFVQTGLFQYSRHPNFFFEQAQWWALFLIGAVAARSVVEWTVVGPLLLTMLFVGSTAFTEKITLSRYPEYAEYQRQTSAVVPWFPKPNARSVRAVESE